MSEPRKTPILRIIARVLIALTSLLIIGCAAALSSWSSMPGESHKGPPPKIESMEHVMIKSALHRHVTYLASSVGPRNDGHPKGYRRAQEYLEAELSHIGYEIELHEVEGSEGPWYNVEVTLRGTERPDDVIIIGGHYDSWGDGPGADDNASSVAVMLELARLLGAKNHPSTLRFVFFANEEPPHFKNPTMGSRQYAAKVAEAKEQVRLAIVLDMVGYFDDAPNTQNYPGLLAPFYPTTGNFVGLVGRRSEADMVREMVATFRKGATLPSEGLAGPEWITGIDYSDHWSFWRVGIPAIFVTDTSFFRTPHYHETSDTAETLNYESMTHVTLSLEAFLLKLLQ